MLRRDRDELDRFLDRVTINVSQLWRHPEQFDVLGRDVLPDLARAGRIRAWSAGCSYGAEAYTLAAVCRRRPARERRDHRHRHRRAHDRARPHRHFTAGDARSGAGAMATWFTSCPTGAARRSRSCARCAASRSATCCAPGRGRGAYDLVMCRNTVIYFNDEVRDALHARLATRLRPGGYLVVGATERVADPARIGLVPTHPFTYRKI